MISLIAVVATQDTLIAREAGKTPSSFAGGPHAGSDNWPTRYTITKLGPIDNTVFNAQTVANDVNQFGDVVGRSTNGENGGGQMTFGSALWLARPAFGRTAGTHEIPPTNYDAHNRAYGINDLGQICGFAPPTDGLGGTTRAYRYDPWTDQMVDLSIAGYNAYSPHPKSFASAINNDGVVVGYTTVDGTLEQPRLFWQPFIHDGDEMTVLPTFGGVYGKAVDINNDGHIVGFATYIDPDSPVWDPLFGEQLAAALWLQEPAYGLPAGIHDLTPNRPDTFGTDAKAINDHGEVLIVYPYVHDNNWTYSNSVALWLPEPNYGFPAGTTVVGQFNYEDERSTSAQNMNNRGEIVGTYNYAIDTNGIPLFHAFLYRGGAWHDLNNMIPPSLSWNLERAWAINDAGQIVGDGTFFNFQTGSVEYLGFLLTPDPESVPGAASREGVITPDDVRDVIDQFGTTSSESDLNADGTVDNEDVVELIRRSIRR